MTSGDMARPTRPKSALKARKVDFLELLKKQVNNPNPIFPATLYNRTIHKNTDTLNSGR